MQIDVFSTINAIDPQAWDTLCGSRPFVEHRWMRLVEAVLVGYEPRYIVLSRQGKWVAGAVGSLQRYFHSSVMQKAVNRVLHYAPCLSCGVPISFDPGLLIAAGESEAELFPELLRVTRELAAREHASFYKVDHLTADDPVWPFLRELNYHSVNMLTEINVDTPYASWDAYLEALPRKKRIEVRRIERLAEQNGIAIQTGRPTPENSAGLERLHSNVLERYQERKNTYVDNFYLKAADVLEENLVLVTAHKDGRMVACLILLRSQDALTAKWLGRDYEYLQEGGLYARLVLECVRQSIRLGTRRLRLGPTAYQTKVHFGAYREERLGAVAVRGQMLNRIAGRILRMTKNPVEEARRQPEG